MGHGEIQQAEDTRLRHGYGAARRSGVRGQMLTRHYALSTRHRRTTRRRGETARRGLRGMEHRVEGKIGLCNF
jgi:hypothetical protein